MYRSAHCPDLPDVSTPDELAERFIRHTTKPGDIVFDPFAGEGAFLLAASKLGRTGQGAETNNKNVVIAAKRGCVVKMPG